jgi:hypothetical protein
MPRLEYCGSSGRFFSSILVIFVVGTDERPEKPVNVNQFSSEDFTGIHPEYKQEL